MSTSTHNADVCTIEGVLAKMNPNLLGPVTTDYSQVVVFVVFVVDLVTNGIMRMCALPVYQRIYHFM